MYYPAFIELLIRTVYFKAFQSLSSKKKKKSKNKISINQLDHIIKDYPINKGDSLMVHSSLSKIEAQPEIIIKYLRSIIGEEGTLLMPTHPKLIKEDGFLKYDIQKSKSRVGYLTEVFRNSSDVLRSKLPFASLAITGPKAEEYLKDELYTNVLPHGKMTPYQKFCLDGGKVLCIGVSAGNRATVKHVPEEVLDDEFILKNVFIKKNVRIYNDGKFYHELTVRERTEDLIPFLANSRLERDLVKNGIIIKRTVNDIPIDYLDAKKCYEWMLLKAKNGYIRYPYAKYIPKYRITKAID
jgi:aminoglycoside N3'-acetyltransferase